MGPLLRYDEDAKRELGYDGVNLLGAQKEVQAAAAFESTLTSEIETPSKQ